MKYIKLFEDINFEDIVEEEFNLDTIDKEYLKESKRNNYYIPYETKKECIEIAKRLHNEFGFKVYDYDIVTSYGKDNDYYDYKGFIYDHDDKYFVQTSSSKENERRYKTLYNFI